MSHPKTKSAVVYLRVSTVRQGIQGLGIEAQRTAVAAFCEQRGYEQIAEYVEAESGRKSARPQLIQARAHARRTRSTLVVAKLDRLSRDAAMIIDIIDSKEPVAFCDFPDIPEGAAGRFMLMMFASVAEFESRLISQRTKAALAEAKKRGVKLGNAEKLQEWHRNNPNHRQLERARAEKEARDAGNLRDIRPMMAQLRDKGIITLGGIADELNRRGIVATGGGQWHRTTVSRVLRSIEASSAVSDTVRQ